MCLKLFLERFYEWDKNFEEGEGFKFSNNLLDLTLGSIVNIPMSWNWRSVFCIAKFLRWHNYNHYSTSFSQTIFADF